MHKHLEMKELEADDPLVREFDLPIDDPSTEFNPSAEASAIIDTNRPDFVGKTYQFFVHDCKHEENEPCEKIILEVSP